MGTTRPKVIVVVGETATGKTRVAIELARALDGEIVNADSMQVYRGMDIGTAKPTPGERAAARFHLIDVASPREAYSAGRFARDARDAIQDIRARGKHPIVAGGTGLYVKVLFSGMMDAPPIDRDFREAMKKMEAEDPGFLHRRLAGIDPERAAELAPRDVLRIVRALEIHHLTGDTMSARMARHRFQTKPYETFKIGLRMGGEELSRRIEARVDEMLTRGLAREVRALLDTGMAPDAPALSAVGYKEIVEYLRGDIDLSAAREKIVIGTRQLAKHQRTWFRRDREIGWYDMPQDEARLLRDAAAWVAAGPSRGKDGAS